MPQTNHEQRRDPEPDNGAVRSSRRTGRTGNIQLHWPLAARSGPVAVPEEVVAILKLELADMAWCNGLV
jgi:hypothetical protein